MIGKLQRMRARLTEICRYATAPSDSAEYVGLLGIKNLGDEAVFLAIRECFSSLPVTYCRPLERWPWLQRGLDARHRRCVILGGGTLIGHRSPIEHFRDAIGRHGVGVVFGTGVAPRRPNCDNGWLEVWAEVLGQCRYVGVRGPDSVELLASVGVHAEVLGDPACWFVQEDGFWQPRGRLLGINIGHSYGNIYGSEERLFREVGAFVACMRGQGWDVEFFVVWPEDLDVTLTTARLAGVSRPVVHAVYDDPRVFLDRVRCVDAFLGLKLHAVVHALCAHVPAIMIEYNPKCLDFMRSIGMEEFSIRTDQVNQALLYQLMDKLLSLGEQVSKSARERLRCYRTRQAARAEHICSALLGTRPWPQF